MDFRIMANQGSDYVVEADNQEIANEYFGVIRQRRGLDNLNNFKVTGIELIEDECPTHYIGTTRIT